MKVHLRADPTDVAETAADHLCELITGPTATLRPVLGLPTGRTAVPFYGSLRRRYRDRRLDLSEARSFNLDELLLPRDHPASFARFMERHAWAKIGLRRDRCEIPRSTSDPEAECARYDRALTAAGGLDVAILGVGEDGHIAYNLPGPVTWPTHIVNVPETVADRMDLEPSERPLRAITLGIDALVNARRVLLMATGSSKADAVAALLDGPVNPQWPCSLLRDHPRLEVFIDPAAAEATHRARDGA